MNFDNLTQRDLENYANDHRMDKVKISYKDRKLLNYIAHSAHPNQKYNGHIDSNPYRGIWTPEQRIEIINHLVRIRDKYKLRMYENIKDLQNKKTINNLIERNKNLQESNNLSIVNNAITDMKKIQQSYKLNDKGLIFSEIEALLFNLTNIDNELDMLRNIYNDLIKKKWIHKRPNDGRIWFEPIPDYVKLCKERKLIYKNQSEFVLCKMIAKIVEDKGWMPDTSGFVEVNELLIFVHEHLHNVLPDNN